MPPGDTTAVERLLQLIRVGDAEARRQLAAQACDRLHTLTRTMLRADFARLRRWEETDDVYQSALIRLHLALTTVVPESPQHFFNLAALQVRRELLSLAEHYYGPQGVGANHHTDGQSAKGPEKVLDVTPSTCDGPQTAAEWCEFHAAVEALPDDEREAFNLTWYQGLSQEEAAVVLGVSVRTFKRRWQEAKLRLYGALGGNRPGGSGVCN